MTMTYDINNTCGNSPANWSHSGQRRPLSWSPLRTEQRSRTITVSPLSPESDVDAVRRRAQRERLVATIDEALQIINDEPWAFMHNDCGTNLQDDTAPPQ